MKLRRSVTGKILLTAGVNMALLVVSLSLLIEWQLDSGVNSILLSQTHSRLMELSRQLNERLKETQRDKWDGILAVEGDRLSLKLSLFLNNGQFVAGSEEKLPEAVRHELTMETRDPRSPEPHVGERPPLPPAGFSQLLSHDPPPGGGSMGPGPVGALFLIHSSIHSGGASGYWFGARMPVFLDPDEEPEHGTLMMSSSSLFFNPALFDVRPWVIGLLAIAALSAMCWVPLIVYLTRSLRNLQMGALRIASGDFKTRVTAGQQEAKSSTNTDEIGHLSESLNRMAAQLDGFISGQQRFLGDVAHELSAPIARTQVAIAILEQRSEQSTQVYVHRLDSELQHMSSLVHELLQMTRANLESHPEEPSVVLRVGDVIARVIEREAQGLDTVRLEQGGELQLRARSEDLCRAVSNVVRNGLRYAGERGPITVSARHMAGAGSGSAHVAITVSDCGPGVPEEMLDRIFTPFYRVDNSRSRTSGGVGLGLAIVKSAIEKAGGSVTCNNRKPHGLEVTMVLPAA